MSLILVWSFFSFSSSISPNLNVKTEESTTCTRGIDMRYDPTDPVYYDDPDLTYTIDKPVKGWDEKRRRWLELHPSFIPGAENRTVMVTGSQSAPCKNPIGDHLLLRFFKNKVDYCRIHGHDIFYSNALLHPKMNSYWAKLPAVKAAMIAHPEAEWIWWVDSDALFTDMDFTPPWHRYRNHNLVVKRRRFSNSELSVISDFFRIFRIFFGFFGFRLLFGLQIFLTNRSEKSESEPNPIRKPFGLGSDSKQPNPKNPKPELSDPYPNPNPNAHP